MWKVPVFWEEAKAHLRSVDPVMGAVIDAHEDPPLRSKGRVFETLIHAIVGQQISAKAAAAVWGRLCELVGDVTPESVSMHSVESLRAVGLSGRKVEYILGLATTGQWVDTLEWSTLSDIEVRKKLIALRGIGPWTVEMVLIFSLLRPDVLPLGDIGVIRAAEQLYVEGARLSPEQVGVIAEKWAPYRSAATWYLWRHLDSEPVEY